MANISNLSISVNSSEGFSVWNMIKRSLVILGISAMGWFLLGAWQALDIWDGVYQSVAVGEIPEDSFRSAVRVSFEASISMVGITGSLLMIFSGLICNSLLRSSTTIVRWWRGYLMVGGTLVFLSLLGSGLFVPIIVGNQSFSVGLGSPLFANTVAWSATLLNYSVAMGGYLVGVLLVYHRAAVKILTNIMRLQNQVISPLFHLIQRMLKKKIAKVGPLVNNNTVGETRLVNKQGYQTTQDDDLLIPPPDEQTGTNTTLPHNDALSIVIPGLLSLPPSVILHSNGTEYCDTDAMIVRAQEEASEIENSLLQHGIEVIVRDIKPGPTVTVYGLEPGWSGTRSTVAPEKRRRVTVDAILAREKDLALALAVPSLRFEAPVPGASLVGIEVPNPTPSVVLLGGVLQRDKLVLEKGKGSLPVVLGKSASGDRVVADLALMPHLLTAGATGSGKSMFVNSLLVSLLMQFSPQELRLLLIDPKRVELTQYNGVPHLAAKVVVDPSEAVLALRGAVQEMMSRLKLLEETGSRNIDSYNSKMNIETDKLAKLVIVVDEMADLMMLAPNDIEHALCRLAQLGRATGIHLVVATQRPSVDVITGLIKANFPSRISFAVASQTDSRTILDGPGADKLLGNGDMLFLSQDLPKPKRVQGTFISDSEIEALVEYWKSSGYRNEPLIELEVSLADQLDGRSSDARDSLFDEAVALSEMHSRISTSLLQRRLRIGYPRAARLRDELETAGVLSRTGDVQSSEE